MKESFLLHNSFNSPFCLFYVQYLFQIGKIQISDLNELSSKIREANHMSHKFQATSSTDVFLRWLCWAGCLAQPLTVCVIAAVKNLKQHKINQSINQTNSYTTEP